MLAPTPFGRVHQTRDIGAIFLIFLGVLVGMVTSPCGKLVVKVLCFWSCFDVDM
jgi:hypothetical protein